MRNDRHAVMVAILLMLAACHAADGPTKEDGFTVHEWGVFTYYQNQAFANAGLDASWKELPPEVFGVLPQRKIPSRCVGADKPVVYFYNTAELKSEPIGGEENPAVQIPGAVKAGTMVKWSARKVGVRVDFPGGAPLVWFPATKEPMGEWWGRGGRREDVSPPMERFSGVRGTPDHLSWDLLFPVSAEKPEIKCPEYRWKDQALKPDADAFSVDWYLQDCQKFLFYEGLLPNKNGVVLRVENTAAGAKFFAGNAGKFAALDLWVIQREGAKLRIGRLDSLPVPSKIRDLPETEIKAEELAEGVQGAMKLLAGQLIAAGLYRSEAEGLVAIWKKEFFETPGVHLLYRLPETEYEQMLPLRITPAPKRLVRAGLAWMPHLELDLKERVAALAQQLGDEIFERREEAFRSLSDMGPAALAFMEAEQKAAKDEEIRSRLRKIIDSYTLNPDKHLEIWKKHLEKNTHK